MPSHVPLLGWALFLDLVQNCGSYWLKGAFGAITTHRGVSSHVNLAKEIGDLPKKICKDQENEKETGGHMKDIKIEKKGKAFVGIDVHAKTYKVCILSRGKKKKILACPAEPSILVKTLTMVLTNYLEIHTVYEAGFSGFTLHRALKKAGMKNIVVDPGSVLQAPNDRVKTDKKDSEALARLHMHGVLKGIKVPSLKQDMDRQVIRTRQQLVDHRKSIMNQCRTKLHQFGLMPSCHCGVLTLMFVKKIEKELKGALKTALLALVRVWENLNDSIKELDAALKAQATDADEILRTIPGIGKLTARKIVVELGSMRQFSSDKKLAGFVGLVPSEHSSGESQNKGSITKRGSSSLRCILTQAAWRAVGKDNEFKKTYERIRNRRGAKIAIIAVARKMILTCRALLIKNEPYKT